MDFLGSFETDSKLSNFLTGNGLLHRRRATGYKPTLIRSKAERLQSLPCRCSNCMLSRIVQSLLLPLKISLAFLISLPGQGYYIELWVGLFSWLYVPDCNSLFFDMTWIDKLMARFSQHVIITASMAVDGLSCTIVWIVKMQFWASVLTQLEPDLQCCYIHALLHAQVCWCSCSQALKESSLNPKVHNVF